MDHEIITTLSGRIMMIKATIYNANRFQNILFYYCRIVRKFVLQGRTALHYAAGVGGAAGLYQHMLEQGALDTIKDQVCLALTMMHQRGPWTPSRTRFV